MSQTPKHVRTGIKEKGPGYRFSTESYLDLQVLYIIEGELYLALNPEEEIRLRPGQILVLGRGTNWSYYCKDKGYKGVFVIMLGAEAPEYHAVNWFPCEDKATRNMVEAIRIVAADARLKNLQILNNLGMAMMWRVLGMLPEQESLTVGHSYSEHWAIRARERIDTELSNQKPLQEVLGDLRLSYRQLSRYFHAVYGISLKEYQRNARMIEASKLLRNSRRAITYIAVELGFASSQHFAREFKKVFHVSPTRYRELAASGQLHLIRAKSPGLAVLEKSVPVRQRRQARG